MTTPEDRKALVAKAEEWLSRGRVGDVRGKADPIVEALVEALSNADGLQPCFDCERYGGCDCGRYERGC